MKRAIIGAALMLALSLPAFAGQSVTVTDGNTNAPASVSGGALSVNVISTITQPTNITQIAGTTLLNTRGLPTIPFSVANSVGQPCIGVSSLTGTLVPSANQSIALASGTTQQVVALAASQVVHVCSFDISASVTIGATFSFEYGTGVNCAGGTVVFANYVIGVATAIDIGRGTGGQDLFSIPSGNAFCIVSGGFTGTAFLNSGTSQY